MTKIRRLGKVIVELTRKLEEANAKLERFRDLFDLEEMVRDLRQEIRDEIERGDE